MESIPREESFDSSVSVLREGYPFIQNRIRRYHSDLFEMRLMLEKTICIHGEEAASLFYDPSLFERKDAIPKAVQKTLLGENGIHTLNEERHRCRKDMFVSVLMAPHNIRDLMQRMATEWQAAIRKWENREGVVLFTEARDILTRASCAWAGIPLPKEEVERRAKDFIGMIDAFGSAGFRHLRGRRARSRAEGWIKGIIRDIRSGKLLPDPDTPAYAVAWHREPDSKLLDPQMAAVELLNAVRPIIAISYYICFTALALHKHPHYRQQLREGGDREAEYFAQEVRRFYPFAPFLGARVRKDFTWQGHRFRKGTLVLLDVYGTLHDPRLWEQPERFWPERFRNWPGTPFDLIPQGGGGFRTGHRCPGEWITIEGMKVALTALTRCMTFEVPEQDLGFDLSRMPTLPKSRVVLTKVRSTGQAVAGGKVPQCPFHH
jgi:fatty-acid peroxygenase